MAGIFGWLTSRRIVGFVAVQALILGLIGSAVFIHFGGFGGPDGDSEGYIEILNYGNQPVDVTVILVDVQTDSQIFEMKFTLGTDGKEGHYSLDWPSMTVGEKRLTVIVDEDRSSSYEFDVSEDGDGPNLSITIKEEEIEFSLESSGM